MASVRYELVLPVDAIGNRVSVPVALHNAQQASAFIAQLGPVGISGASVEMQAGGDGGDPVALETSLIAGGSSTITLPGRTQRIIVDSLQTLDFKVTAAISTTPPNDPATALVVVTLRGDALTDANGNAIGPGGGGGGGGSGPVVMKI